MMGLCLNTGHLSPMTRSSNASGRCWPVWVPLSSRSSMEATSEFLVC